MAPESFEIDPHADTIIILKEPSVFFAVWGQPDVWDLNVWEKTTSKKEETATKEEKTTTKKKKKKGVAIPYEVPSPPPPPVEEIQDEEPPPPPRAFEDLKPEEPPFNSSFVEYPEDPEPLPPTPLIEYPDGDYFPPPPRPVEYLEEEAPLPPSPPPVKYPEDEELLPPSPPPELPPTEEPTTEETVVEEPAPEPETYELSPYEKGVHYHVSASHLRLASPKFNSMLGIENEKYGHYYILVQDWDKEALLILLNVVHLRHRNVPRAVSLEMLAKLATLIDYYDCAEAAEGWTERWIDHLKTTSPIPSTHCRDLMLWMCIAWVLRLPSEFAQTTAVAIKQSKQKELPTLGLPITGFVDRIDQARVRAIATVDSQLRILLHDYRAADYCCPRGSQYSFECGSILYGALTKGLVSSELSYLFVPFAGISFCELQEKVKSIKSPMWMTDYDGYHLCNLGVKVTEMADMVLREIHGLDLKDFGGTPIR
ncbi:hypothetical protein BU16DRAFT_532128 [Lophium mytilinum]|uniref:BTB domain-containing protein n=1 Tax=Lophium mytilinum TaxID=390894 RepID=A0A6A6QAH2_9PEZI|nr:hypothetical protein BU16DRAFT_532128 [Lophium mytilinum]